MEKPDSIIFDMDGTLWDGVGAYIESWNRGLKKCNISKAIDKEEFLSMVGWEKRKVLERLLPEYDIESREAIHDTVSSFLPESITEVGGHLYDGVKEGLAQLATRYKLFIVSNCPEGLIQLFMNWAGISNYIIDEVAHGINSMPKHHNIQLLVDKHNLKNAIYVGDTAGDSEQSELAKVPFVFVSYGFGSTDKYALKFDDFNAFTKHFMKLE
ncbi:MAG: HAD family hydrolase [Sphingobacteriaceae bacterium]